MFHAQPLLLHSLLTLGALVLDRVFGYPDALFRAIRHPVVWMGALIARLDRGLNRGAPGCKRLLGVLAVFLLLAATLPCWLLQAELGAWAILLIPIAASLPAQRSLWRHVRDVAEGLEAGGLAAGRAAVSRIVGRDPETLDEAGVIRAAIESLAENFSDGVVAPAVWGVAAGLAGMAGYKAVNTADSMIGHRTPRYREFGWAAARLDDLVNLPASRLSALWIVLAACLQPGADAGAACRAVWRDAGKHRSPNAGWPEAAMAGALGLRLAGPRWYGGAKVEDHWMGDGRDAATLPDLRRALALYRRACVIQIAGIAVLALLIWRF